MRREPRNEAMLGVNSLVPSFFHMGKNSVMLLLESLGTRVWLCGTIGKESAYKIVSMPGYEAWVRDLGMRLGYEAWV